MSERVGDAATAAACEICGGSTAPRSLPLGGSLDRCGECGHLRRSLVDAPADHRDAAYGGDPGMDRARIHLTHRALRRMGPTESVFEIGFGSGALLREFLRDGSRVGGVDPDQLGVHVDPIVRAEGQLFEGTIEDVPQDAFSADLVVGIHVIEHVENPVLTLQKAAALTAPGGRVVMLTPAGDSWGPSTFGSAWWMLEDPTHVRFFTENSLVRAAQRAGLVNIKVDRLIVDSISVDVASAARAMRPSGAAGALAQRPVRYAALASTPVVVALRLIAARTRPTLRLTAERGPL